MSGVSVWRRASLCLAAALAVVGVAAAVEAQLGLRSFSRVRLATPADFDGHFQFCRVVFDTDFRGDGNGWDVDFPRAEINLSIRLAEMTRAKVSVDPLGTPNHLLVRLTDPELFSCPFIMMTEPGGAGFGLDEAAALREHLLKGGFLWVDDFWGSFAWEWWARQLGQALPPHEFPIIELPADHAMFRMLLRTDGVPQVPSIGHWASARNTSERGADSAVATARAVLDASGRIMVLMTHNTDFGDSWEREADDPQYFYQFSVPGYAFGINTLLYALTH